MIVNQGWGQRNVSLASPILPISLSLLFKNFVNIWTGNYFVKILTKKKKKKTYSKSLNLYK